MRARKRILLTDLAVANAPSAPKGQRTHLWDSVRIGLALRTTESGAKSWVVFKRPRGKGRAVRVTLGSYPEMRLKRARELARPIIEDLESGIDPAAARRAEALAAERREEGEVEKALTVYQATVVDQWRSRRETRRMFSVYVLPRWRGRFIADLRRSDVLKLRDQIAADNGRVIADRVLEALNTFFRWCANRDEEFRSPMPPVWRLCRRQDLARDRVLNDAEIRALWAASQAVVPALYGGLVRLLLLSGQRLGDWQRAGWDEISDDALNIAGSRYKAGKPHSVPLTAAMKAELKALPRSGDYLFQLRRTGPFANLSKAKARLDELMLVKMKEAEAERGGDPAKVNLPPWRVHDLRRTSRSLLSRAGVRRDIAERVIGHSVGGFVEQTYDRHKYVAERRAALIALGELIERIIAGKEAQVIELGAQRAVGAAE